MADDEEGDARKVSPIFQPDVVAWRLGQVEKQSEENGKQIGALTTTVQEFIAAMPANYVPRKEHEQVDVHRHEWSLQKMMLVLGAVNLVVVVAVNLAIAIVPH